MMKIKMPLADTAVSARGYAIASMALVSLQVAGLGVVPATRPTSTAPKFSFKIQEQNQVGIEIELAELLADMEAGKPFAREDGAAAALQRLENVRDLDMDQWMDEVAESLSDAAD